MKKHTIFILNYKKFINFKEKKKMQLKHNNNANFYIDLLDTLNESSKKELIAHLSKSIAATKKNTSNSFYNLFGAWKSNESAEDIIKNIKTSRSFTRKIESF